MELTWLDRVNAAIEEAFQPEPEPMVTIYVIVRRKKNDEYRFENGVKFEE